MAGTRGQYFVRSVERTLSVLRAFSPERPELTLTEVAQACGLSKPTIYHYFRDKYALLVDITDGHMTRLQALVDEVQAMGLPPEPRLRMLIERFVQEYAHARHAHRVLTEDVRFVYLARQDAPVKRAVAGPPG